MVISGTAKTTARRTFNGITLGKADVMGIPVDPDDIRSVRRSNGGLIVALGSNNAIAIRGFFIINDSNRPGRLMLRSGSKALFLKDCSSPCSNFAFNRVNALRSLVTTATTNDAAPS